MTRKKLVQYLLTTYGQKVTVGGQEAWAVIRPLRKQSGEAPQCYPNGHGSLPGDSHRVGILCRRKPLCMGCVMQGKGNGVLYGGGCMNPEENHELLDKLSEQLERDVRRYPQEFKEGQS